MLVSYLASTDPDLTTTGKVRGLLLGGGATSTVQDAIISLAIRAASRWAESYIGYPLSVASYRETRPGYGRRNLMITQTPVRAVRRLYDSTDTGGTAILLLSSEFRVEDAEGGLLSRDDGWSWTVPGEMDLSDRPVSGNEYKPWYVEYVAGYTYGGLSTDSVNWSTEQGSTSTGRTLPEDIEEAVAHRALSYVDGSHNVVQETLGDLKIQYRSGRVDDPAPSIAEQLLNNYVRVV